MEGEVCIANIGARGRRRRMNFGIVSVASGLVVAALLMGLGALHLFRLLVFLPIWAGAIGIFQATGRT
jgi:hypothetical protein